MTAYTGTSASETLNSSNWNYSWNVFYMTDGNDTVSTPITGTAYWFYGGNGNDHFLGDSANDTAYGGNDNDTLFGSSGNDYVRGEAGNDTLNGGSGNDIVIGDGGRDYLYGSTGQDNLWGGTDTSIDYFQFTRGDSNAIAGQHDVINDWNRSYDYIDSSLKGTSTNYAEASTGALSITTARGQVENSSTLKYEDHVFLYNAQTDTGYLLSDLDSNYTFETGVMIRGAGSASDMAYSDII